MLWQAPVFQFGKYLARSLRTRRALVDQLLKSIRDGFCQRIAGIDAEPFLDEVLGAGDQFLIGEKPRLELLDLGAEHAEQPVLDRLSLVIDILAPHIIAARRFG